MSLSKIPTLTLALALGTLSSAGARATGWKYAIEPKYDFAGNFSNGWGVVGFDYEFTQDAGYIDAQGNLLGGRINYGSAQTFENGHAVVIEHGYPDANLLSVIDTAGKEVMRPKWEPRPNENPACQNAISYRLEGGFNYGLIPISIVFSAHCPDHEGYVDEGGHIRFFNYYSVKPFHDGVAVVWPAYTGEFEGNRHLIDLQGNKISETFDRIEPSSEGLSVACTAKRCGLLNTDGSFFKPLEYDDLQPFSEHYAAFKKGNLWGYLDRNGVVAIPPCLAEAGNFHEGLAAVTKPDGEAGYIDPMGAWAFKVEPGTKLHDLEDFSEGYVVAKTKDIHYGYLDKNGNWAVPAIFGAARPFHEGVAAVSSGTWDYPNNGHWGYIRITE